MKRNPHERVWHGLPLPVLISAVLLLILRPPLWAAESVAPLALVNGEKVTMADYRLFLLKLPPDLTAEGIDKEILRKLIDEKLILQEAGKRGLTVTDDEVKQSVVEFLRESNLTEKDFEEQITGKGMSIKEYRRWLKENIIVVAKLTHQEVDGKVTVEEDEVRRYYEVNRDRFVTGPERVRIKAIFLRLEPSATLAEVTALKIKALRQVAELKSGTSFDTLAALYPENTLKAQDGVLGEFRKGDLVPALEKGIDALKDGDISQPLWLKEGAYIIKLEGRIRTLSPLDAVRQDIRNRIYYEKKHALYGAWVKTLWERSAVTIY